MCCVDESQLLIYSGPVVCGDRQFFPLCIAGDKCSLIFHVSVGNLMHVGPVMLDEMFFNDVLYSSTYGIIDNELKKIKGATVFKLYLVGH